MIPLYYFFLKLQWIFEIILRTCNLFNTIRLADAMIDIGTNESVHISMVDSFDVTSTGQKKQRHRGFSSPPLQCLISCLLLIQSPSLLQE
jgi:hypothetical protein